MSPEATAGAADTSPRDLPKEQRVKVNEIFYSLQGESTFAGRPCVLVRLTGCQMRCAWCDSEHSFYEGRWMSLEEVLAEVARFGCPLVELTGGEPLLQAGARPLLARARDAGTRCCSRPAAGSTSRGWTRGCAASSTSSAPGAARSRTTTGRISRCSPGATSSSSCSPRRRTTTGRATWSSRKDLADRCEVHFSPVWGALDPRQLAAWMLADRLPVRVQVQLHKVLWGPDARGV